MFSEFILGCSAIYCDVGCVVICSVLCVVCGAVLYISIGGGHVVLCAYVKSS